MKKEHVTFTAADGFELKGLWLEAEENTQGTAVLHSATSVKKEYYLKFASFLAEQGYDILIYDYRGIGEAQRGSLKDLQATMHEYGTLDQNAALAYLIHERGRTGITWLGHSVGSQLMGVVNNMEHVRQVLAINCSTGYWGYFPFPWNLMSLYMWHLAGPLLTTVKGYFPASMLGMGEPLPKGVFYEWRRWCNSRTHFRKWLRKTRGIERFQGFKVPITAIYTSDDYIAGKKTVAALLDFYPDAEHKVIEVEAKQLGGKVGHLGIFRSKFQETGWPIILREMKAGQKAPVA